MYKETIRCYYIFSLIGVDRWGDDKNLSKTKFSNVPQRRFLNHFDSPHNRPEKSNLYIISSKEVNLIWTVLLYVALHTYNLLFDGFETGLLKSAQNHLLTFSFITLISLSFFRLPCQLEVWQHLVLHTNCCQTISLRDIT